VLFKPKGKDKKAPRVAEAVEFVSKGKTYKVYAKKEVIVSAGVFVLAVAGLMPPSLATILRHFQDSSALGTLWDRR
jgi:hypothetical protein